MKSSGFVTALCLASSAAAFSPPPPAAAADRRGAALRAARPRVSADAAASAVHDDDRHRRCRSRGEFLSSCVVASAAAVLSSASAFAIPAASRAVDEGTAGATATGGDAAGPAVHSIAGCEPDQDDCVSTANIRDAKGSYSPPWTFETSPDEAFARIKGVLASDDSYVVTEVDDGARYVRAYARRITPDADEVEFLVRADDRVVLFRSTARRNGSVSDFGANRKRIDDIRRRGAVFGLMGDGLTADSYNGGGEANRNNGPLGQLKAFYGLQSGRGFEKLFEEEEGE